MDDHDHLPQLEQELRDERARRREAESRIDELTSRANQWRQRAEERSVRIERMVEEETRRRSRLGRLIRGLVKPRRGRTEDSALDRGSSAEQHDSLASAVQTTPPARAWPSIRSVMVVSAVSDLGMTRALSAFDVTDLSAARPSDLERADLVVIDPRVIDTLGGEAQYLLSEWSRQTGRQPLVVWASRNEIQAVSGLLNRGDVVITSDPDLANQLDIPFVQGSFDPSLHNPRKAKENLARKEGSTMPGDPSKLLSTPSVEMIEAGAAGIAFSSDAGASTAARRWAYRYHAPWIRAAQILKLAGLRGPDPVPRIASVLVSHRPDSVPQAVEAILRQTHPRLELLVALHGATVTPEIERVLSSASIPVEIISLKREHSLGECLNRAIAQTSAPVLAKFDDDDYYGAAHIEDSFHALAYSMAEIVGKGAQFTYLASKDSTVLRRPGQEEMFIDGSPNGATLVFRRSVWEETGFPNRPRHVDTGFLRAARSIGARVYVGKRWEFCYVRNRHGHTWEAEDTIFLAGSEPAWKGFHPERVEVPDVHVA